MHNPDQLSNPHPDIAEFDNTDLELIPGITIIGQDDPLERPADAPFPEIVYHAYPDRGEGFSLDIFHAGGQIGYSGNDHGGAGIYCADRKLAGIYQANIDARDGQTGGLAKLMPHRAVMLDDRNPEIRAPLGAELASNMLDHAHGKGLIGAAPEMYRAVDQAADYIDNGRGLSGKLLSSHDAKILADEFEATDKRVVDAAVRYLNTLSILEDVRDGEGVGVGVSVQNLLNKKVDVDSGGFQIDRTIVQSYLMDQGVDGRLFRMRPSVDKDNSHVGAVFWKLDHLGDETTHEKRLYVHDMARDVGSFIARHVDKPSPVQPERISDQRLTGNHRITAFEADYIQRELNGGRGLDERAGRGLWERVVSTDVVDPYLLVSYTADKSEAIGRLMAGDVGVWEGYRLHEHTQAVLGQYEKFYAPQMGPEGAMYNGVMRTTLLLQDIGKPLAVAYHDKPNQARYNLMASEPILASMPLDGSVKDLITDMIGQDYIGRAIKSGRQEDIDAAVRGISSMAERHKSLVIPFDMFNMLQTAYKCDTSAYTEQATYISADQRMRRPAMRALDHLFEVAPRADRMRLREKPDAILAAIGQGVSRTT